MKRSLLLLLIVAAPSMSAGQHNKYNITEVSLISLTAPSGKRGWKRHFGIVRDVKLLLWKSDKKAQCQSVKQFIDLDNAYASVATHYTKRKNGFTITTSNGSEYLFIAG